MTTRRGFLSGILVAATPPGFVQAGVLMPVRTIVAPSPVVVQVVDFIPATEWARISRLEIMSRHEYANMLRALHSRPWRGAVGSSPAS